MDEGAVDPVGAADICPVHACVVATVLVMDGADDGDVMHAFRHARQQFGDVHAGNVGTDGGEDASGFARGVRFWIPEVDVTGGASVEDEDDGFGAASEGALLCGARDERELGEDGSEERRCAVSEQGASGK